MPIPDSIMRINTIMVKVSLKFSQFIDSEFIRFEQYITDVYKNCNGDK